MLLEPIAEGLTYQDLQSYARTLLASTAESKTRSSNGIRDPVVFHAGEDQGQGMDGVSGCREAVEILTRNPKKRECLFIPKFERFAFTSTSSPYRSRCGIRKELSWAVMACVIDRNLRFGCVRSRMEDPVRDYDLAPSIFYFPLSL